MKQTIRLQDIYSADLYTRSRASELRVCINDEADEVTLDFEGIGFHYTDGDAETVVFDGFDLHIPAGQRVGLVGMTLRQRTLWVASAIGERGQKRRLPASLCPSMSPP